MKTKRLSGARTAVILSLLAVILAGCHYYYPARYSYHRPYVHGPHGHGPHHYRPYRHYRPYYKPYYRHY